MHSYCNHRVLAIKQSDAGKVEMTGTDKRFNCANKRKVH